MDVGVIGGSGYAGAELLRLLAGHPTLKLRVVGARTHAGQLIADVFAHLDTSARFVDSTPEQFVGCDVVFCATPHQASMELAPALRDAGSVVVDLSGAFRLDPAVFSRWYGLDHTAPALAPAVYGLPELWRDDLAGATLIAGPGCYPTATLLALAPLAGVVDPASVVVAGLSGWSGAGKSLRDDLHASHADANIAAYAAPRHRHTPEIEAQWARCVGLSAPAPITFVPHLVPTPRGLLSTVTATLRPDVAADAAQIRQHYVEAYDGEPFVRLLGDGAWPQTTFTRGGNAAHVSVAVDARTGRVTAACAIDNLVKGAAGQAIQAANIALGLPQTAGLVADGLYP